MVWAHYWSGSAGGCARVPRHRKIFSHHKFFIWMMVAELQYISAIMKTCMYNVHTTCCDSYSCCLCVAVDDIVRYKVERYDIILS